MLGLSAVLASPAAAHGDLVTSKPEAGATVKKPVDHIIINLTETPTENANVSVIDGCGVDLFDELFVTEKSLHVLLEDDGQPGEWQVSYRVISAEDGHKTNDSYSFTVKGQADCSDPEEPQDGDDVDDEGENEGDDGAAAPPAGPASDEGGSLPIIAVIIGGLALIGIAVLVRMRSS